MWLAVRRLTELVETEAGGWCQLSRPLDRAVASSGRVSDRRGGTRRDCNLLFLYQFNKLMLNTRSTRI